MQKARLQSQTRAPRTDTKGGKLGSQGAVTLTEISLSDSLTRFLPIHLSESAEAGSKNVSEEATRDSNSPSGNRKAPGGKTWLHSLLTLTQRLKTGLVAAYRACPFVIVIIVPC